MQSLFYKTHLHQETAYYITILTPLKNFMPLKCTQQALKKAL